MALEFEPILQATDFRGNGGIELRFVVAPVFWDREHPTSLVPTPMIPPGFSIPARPVRSLRTEYPHYLTKEDQAWTSFLKNNRKKEAA